jgi:hypothetical protein
MKIECIILYGQVDYETVDVLSVYDTESELEAFSDMVGEMADSKDTGGYDRYLITRHNIEGSPKCLQAWSLKGNPMNKDTYWEKVI